MRSLITYLPEYYENSNEVKDLQQAVGTGVQDGWDARDGLCDQLCVDTATWGLAAWEEALGLTGQAGKPDQYRRERIKSKLRGAGTTTVALVKNVSESFSNGEVEVLEYPAQYKISIKFVGLLGVPPNMADLTATLREIMPAHLQWEYIIVYNTWGDMPPFTWAQLAAQTWGGVKEADLDADNA